VKTAFAKALVPLLRSNDTIWVHDYHLFPLGQALRDTGVRCPIGFFLHVPFPPPSLFECLPQGNKLLRTLAAYDAVGVQVPDDAANLNALLDKLGIALRAAVFPVGIDPDAFAKAARRAETGPEVMRLTDSCSISSSDHYWRRCSEASTKPAAISREHSSRSNITRRRSARRLTRAVPTGGTSISTYLIPGFE
jgi:Glycosyltransferase family 20